MGNRGVKGPRCILRSHRLLTGPAPRRSAAKLGHSAAAAGVVAAMGAMRETSEHVCCDLALDLPLSCEAL